MRPLSARRCRSRRHLWTPTIASVVRASRCCRSGTVQGNDASTNEAVRSWVERLAGLQRAGLRGFRHNARDADDNADVVVKSSPLFILPASTRTCAFLPRRAIRRIGFPSVARSPTFRHRGETTDRQRHAANCAKTHGRNDDDLATTGTAAQRYTTETEPGGDPFARRYAFNFSRTCHAISAHLGGTCSRGL